MGMRKQEAHSAALVPKKGQPVPWSRTGTAATATRRHRWNNMVAARPGQAVSSWHVSPPLHPTRWKNHVAKDNKRRRPVPVTHALSVTNTTERQHPLTGQHLQTSSFPPIGRTACRIFPISAHVPLPSPAVPGALSSRDPLAIVL